MVNKYSYQCAFSWGCPGHPHPQSLFTPHFPLSRYISSTHHLCQSSSCTPPHDNDTTSNPYDNLRFSYYNKSHNIHPVKIVATHTTQSSNPGRKRHMRFKPCIDIHKGHVKQIVGSTLSDTQESSSDSEPITNFQSALPSSYYASLYKKHNLPGGHIILLDPQNKATQLAAFEALQAFPHGMHVGGGLNPDNAREYLDAGASHIIVTSYVFRGPEGIEWERLNQMVHAVGKQRLVLDLSCRWKSHDSSDPTGPTGAYYVCTDRWQKWSSFSLSRDSLHQIANYCDEFLVHAVDVEGKKSGIDTRLIQCLGEWSPIPVTYAGGAKSIEDFELTKLNGNSLVDLTVGSALDIFGGNLSFDDAVQWQRLQEQSL